MKGCLFITVAMIEAESQLVLNTLTDRDLVQDAFKIAEALGTVYTCGKGLLRW
jgi:hypothetical protein